MFWSTVSLPSFVWDFKQVNIPVTLFEPEAPYGVRPARPGSYLDFAKKNAVVAAVAGRHVIGILSGLGTRALPVGPL